MFKRTKAIAVLSGLLVVALAGSSAEARTKSDKSPLPKIIQRLLGISEQETPTRGVKKTKMVKRSKKPIRSKTKTKFVKRGKRPPAHSGSPRRR